MDTTNGAIRTQSPASAASQSLNSGAAPYPGELRSWKAAKAAKTAITAPAAILLHIAVPVTMSSFSTNGEMTDVERKPTSSFVAASDTRRDEPILYL